MKRQVANEDVRGALCIWFRDPTGDGLDKSFPEVNRWFEQMRAVLEWYESTRAPQPHNVRGYLGSTVDGGIDDHDEETPQPHGASAGSDDVALNAFMDMFGDLNGATAALVWNFAMALGNKLRAAEQKYGYSDGWRNADWMDECRAKLVEHVAKGDPRDVAAYCAFLWHHGASTTPSQPSCVQDARDGESA